MFEFIDIKNKKRYELDSLRWHREKQSLMIIGMTSSMTDRIVAQWDEILLC